MTTPKHPLREDFTSILVEEPNCTVFIKLITPSEPIKGAIHSVTDQCVILDIGNGCTRHIYYPSIIYFDVQRELTIQENGPDQPLNLNAELIDLNEVINSCQIAETLEDVTVDSLSHNDVGIIVAKPEPKDIEALTDKTDWSIPQTVTKMLDCIPTDIYYEMDSSIRAKLSICLVNLLEIAAANRQDPLT